MTSSDRYKQCVSTVNADKQHLSTPWQHSIQHTGHMIGLKSKTAISVKKNPNYQA